MRWSQMEKREQRSQKNREASWASAKALRSEWRGSKVCKRSNRVTSEVWVQGDEGGEMDRATGRHWTANSSTNTSLGSFPHIFIYPRACTNSWFLSALQTFHLLFSLVKMSSFTLGTTEAWLLASPKKLSLVSFDEVPSLPSRSSFLVLPLMR